MTARQQEVTKAFEESRDDLYYYLLTFGLPGAQAQEATQEVFLRLYVALERGDLIQNLRGWLFRVAHNLGLDMRNKVQPIPLDANLERKVADAASSVEDSLIERQRMAQLSEAWKTLSAQQQQCLHLRSEGLRYREIAEALDISISSVREFLNRAVTRLQRAIDE